MDKSNEDVLKEVAEAFAAPGPERAEVKTDGYSFKPRHPMMAYSDEIYAKSNAAKLSTFFVIADGNQLYFHSTGMGDGQAVDLLNECKKILLDKIKAR